MLSETFTWVGGGIVLILLYIVVSNTLWLLFGSRVIQYLPGVDIKGFRGTIKIATMLILSALGSLRWFVKYAFAVATETNPRPVFSEEVSKAIQQGAKVINNHNGSDRGKGN